MITFALGLHTTLFAGTSSTTIDPAQIIELSPIVIPQTTIAPAQIFTLLPIVGLLPSEVYPIVTCWQIVQFSHIEVADTIVENPC